ncbi:phage tail assembly protein [Clostridiaceae bacterium NSJ-31]|uniref:Phage tail assembly protein n=1 Tax=Ligaoa zhengdingensis TaxID=2763658 RepID=A0A926DZ28_9FIRM|nr:Trm112 family protein [Ligaoa zhengdingensis]MBC8546568.1 phage tail assembly protein [Ligaoa zhengdingensis]
MELDFSTEYEFDLPKGYVDSAGVLHKHGVMRLATAADEILPLRDPRVVQNPGYLTIILLSRVITSLGTVPKIDPRVVEKFYSSDLAFLQDMYQKINAIEPVMDQCVCPECGHKFEQPVNFTSAE